jgi:zinc/manganese transport system permease protein
MSASLNLLVDLPQIWQYQFMQHAFEAGTLTALVAGVTGYFVVIRRSAFTAHAFSEMGFAGAAWAVLYGIPPIAGLLLGSNLGGVSIALLGRRATNRDTQIGIVLAFSLGLGLLFISAYQGYATETYSILFGEILGVSYDAVLETVVATVAVLVALALIYRPLLFSSLDEDVAEAKGLPMLALGMSFMVIVAVAVSFAVQVTGVLLIFSLMVTPGATAQYLSRRPSRAIAASATIALFATWLGLIFAFYTPYPTSFFITGEVFAFYLLVRFAYAARTDNRNLTKDNMSPPVTVRAHPHKDQRQAKGPVPNLIRQSSK